MECSVSILVVLLYPMHGYTIPTASNRVPVNPDETWVVDKMIVAPIIGRLCVVLVFLPLGYTILVL